MGMPTLRGLVKLMRDDANATDTSEPEGAGYADGVETCARNLEDWINQHIGER